MQSGLAAIPASPDLRIEKIAGYAPAIKNALSIRLLEERDSASWEAFVLGHP